MVTMCQGNTPTQPIDIDPHARCRGCGYALRELTEPRCPECGRAFNPQNHESFILPGLTRRRLAQRLHRLSRWLIGRDGLGVQLCIASMIGVLIAGSRPGVPLAIIAIVLLLVMHWMYRTALHERRQRSSTGVRITAAVSLAIVLALSLRYDRCPHARYIGIGPFHVAFDGRACRNSRNMPSLLDRMLGQPDRWREVR